MNGNADDDFTSKAGMVESIASFAASFAVGNCPYYDYKGPLQPCTFTDDTVAKQMCHYIGGHPVFEDCIAVLKWRRYRSICEYDMCAREDPSDNGPFCNMLSALAYACKRIARIKVYWQDTELLEYCSGTNQENHLIMPYNNTIMNYVYINRCK